MNEPKSNAVGEVHWVLRLSANARMQRCNFFFARDGSRLHTAWPWLPPGVFKWNEGTIPFPYCHPSRTPWHGKNCTAMKVRNDLKSCLEHPMIWLEKYIDEV